MSSKLEFYRFKLNHKSEDFKTFKDFAIENLKAGRSVSDEDVVRLCHKHFVQSLTGPYAQDDKAKKKISFQKKRSINKHYTKGPAFDSSSQTIYGVINGGPYGRDRIISNNDDEEDSVQLGQNKTVLMYFLFFAYLPPNHNEGFFIVHSNSRDESITALFRSYMVNLFRGGSFRKPAPETFCPKSFQDEFKKGAVLKSMTFRNSFIDDVHTGKGASDLFNQYDIKIVATPKNKEISATQSENFRKTLGSKIFGAKDKGKTLNSFSKTSMLLENDITGAEKTFEWNERESNFVPVVYLNGRIEKENQDGTPDFDELLEYCGTIFEDEILPEIRPDLNVTKVK